MLATVGLKMKAPLYNDILQLSQNIANASADDNETLRLEACQQLQKLCATNQNNPKDHPLQWEVLADFTEDGDQAMEIYQIALSTAEKLALANFQASIYLAMAQRYQEFEELTSAQEYGEKANAAAITLAKNDSNEALKSEIDDFLNLLKSRGCKI